MHWVLYWLPIQYQVWAYICVWTSVRACMYKFLCLLRSTSGNALSAILSPDTFFGIWVHVCEQHCCACARMYMSARACARACACVCTLLCEWVVALVRVPVLVRMLVRHALVPWCVDLLFVVVSLISLSLSVSWSFFGTVWLVWCLCRTCAIL